MHAPADLVMADTRRWIAAIVIGLNLCPFARRVFEGGGIRYVVTAATDELALLRALNDELHFLAGPDRGPTETTLLIHPQVLADFADYNDFLTTADEQVAAGGFAGVIQIASFHPQYQFAGTAKDAVENFTNRSPYPMLHLLREESVTEVNADPSKVAEIPTRNIAVLRRLGRAGLEELFAR